MSSKYAQIRMETPAQVYIYVEVRENTTQK